MIASVEITLTGYPVSERRWRAVVRLPKQIDWMSAGYVHGAMTDMGAWAEGFGSTPEYALANAQQTIGRCIIGMTQHEPDVKAEDK